MLVLMNEVACMMRGDGDGDGDVRWQVSHGQRHAHTQLDENDAEPKGHKACTGPGMRCVHCHGWLAGDWGAVVQRTSTPLPSYSHSFINSIGVDRRGRIQRRNGLNNKQIVERAKREGW